MATDIDPIVDNWYSNLDKGQRFTVVAVDDVIDIQHFDGDLEELSFDEWRAMNIEVSVQPENWYGALEVGEMDDLGTEITDTDAADWTEPLEEL